MQHLRPQKSDYLIFFENGRLPQLFLKYEDCIIFLKMEVNPNLLITKALKNMHPNKYKLIYIQFKHSTVTSWQPDEHNNQKYIGNKIIKSALIGCDIIVN